MLAGQKGIEIHGETSGRVGFDKMLFECVCVMGGGYCLSMCVRAC